MMNLFSDKLLFAWGFAICMWSFAEKRLRICFRLYFLANEKFACYETNGKGLQTFYLMGVGARAGMNELF